MRRRSFIAAASCLPMIARAQGLPRIAYFSGRSPSTDSHLLDAFRDGLKSAGYIDGRNVILEVRWGGGRYGDMPKAAAEVVATKPDVIVGVGGNPVGVAFKAATSTIPVVFGAGADPVAIGLVKNLNRPEGNLTGMTLWANELDAKRLDLLRDMLPAARSVAVLMNPENPGYAELLPRSREVARALGLELTLLTAASSAEIEQAFTLLPKVDALAVGADAFLINRRDRILALSAERALPGIFPAREFAAEGGLASYGARWPEMYRLLGTYAARLLKGGKPADLPVQRPASYELVINQRTARTLGLTLPPLILARADELIE